MRRTTLTLTAPVFYPELPGGYRQAFHYAPGLRERGVDMKVFTLTRDGEEPGCEVINGIQVYRVDTRHPDQGMERQQLLAPALKAAYADLEKNKQVMSPLGMNWTMARWLWKAKLAGIATSGYITTAPELPENLWKAWRVRLSTSLLIGVFDRLIFCSSAQIDIHCRTSWIPRSKTLTIPNGVRTDRFRPANPEERNRLREKLSLNPDETLFIYVGNIVERKGTDFLIRAWKEVQIRQPKARLLLLGLRTMPKTFRSPEDIAGHQAFETRLQAALASLSPDALPVLFQPPVENVEDWLRAADAFLFPSHCEGLPNALLEAMACGLPAITAPFAGLPKDGEEIGRNGTEFLLLPHEEKAWADAICDLAENPAKRSTLGQAAASWVARFHDYSKVLDRLAEHYHRLGQLHMRR